MKYRSNLRKSFLVIILILGLFPIQIFSSHPIQDILEWEIRVIVEKANIHMEPSEGSPIVTTVPRSSILQSYEKKDDWFRVVYKHENGIVVIGYIQSSQVTAIKEKVVKKTDFWSAESDFFKGIGLTIKVSLGYNYIAAGEINQGLAGVVDYYQLLLSYAGDYFNGGIMPFHSGFDFGADAIYNVTSRIGIGLGLSYVQWGNLDYIRLDKSGSIRRLDSHIRVNAVPVRLGVFYTLPVFKKINLTFNAGPTYYFLNHTYNMQYRPYFVVQKAHGQGWGFHGGIALDLEWNSRSTLFIEYQGRYVNLNNFKGTERNSFNFQGEEGSLLYLEYDYIPSQIGISSQAPEFCKAARNANYDLSGFAIRIGAKIKF